MKRPIILTVIANYPESKPARGITNCSASISLSFNFSTLFSELQSRVLQAECEAVTLVLLLVTLPMLNYYATRLK